MNEKNNHPPYYPSPTPYEEEIDLLDIIKTIWKGKRFIIILTILSSVAAFLYARYQPPLYSAEVVLSPVAEDGNTGMGGLASQYRDLAIMTGFTTGVSLSDTETNIAILKSRQFLYRFIKENKIMPMLFAEKWDKKNEKWDVPNSNQIPTEWQAYKFFLNNVLTIDQDKNTGLITLRIMWGDPQTTKQWANGLVERINRHIREKSITEAQKSIQYLQNEIKKTSDISMQEVLYGLIEKQTRSIMLGQVREQYAFNIIDPAVVPERKSKPNKRLILILGTSGGFAVSVLFWFIIFYIKNSKKN